MNEENNTKKEGAFQNPITQSILGIITIVLCLVGFIFWQENTGTIFIENSTITAPIINLSGITSGTLNALYVKEGDTITANSPVAMIGTDIVTSKQSGIIINTVNSIGTFFSPGMTVVSMVHPEDMTVTGALEENKGLDQIKAGQKATFTVDAFSGKTYVGTVESVSQTSNDTGVVFSISDKRPIKKFDVKVHFDVNAYPELKNGMSAKITVYTK